MRIGIIGGGAAGLVSAWLLQHQHQVTVLEAAPHLGGHAKSEVIRTGYGSVVCETGLRFIFDRNYPVLHALFRCLGLKPRWRPVNLTIHWPDSGRVVVYPPRTPRHYSHLLQPRILLDSLDFQSMMTGLRGMTADDWNVTIGDWGRRTGRTAAFFERVFLPFLAASWGAPVEDMRGFPAGDVGTVLQRPDGPHGIFQFDGGISEYIAALVGAQRSVEHCASTPVQAIRRAHGEWRVTSPRGGERAFDALVLTTAAWDAARLLANVPEAVEWRRRLEPFVHFDTTIVFHEDESFMPPDSRDWSTLNQTHDRERPWTSEWAGQETGNPLFRTWLPRHRPPPRREHSRVEFKHLVMRLNHRALQRDIANAQGEGGIFAAGLYAYGVDNHEATVESALPIARKLAPESPTLAQLEASIRVGGTVTPAGPTSAQSRLSYSLRLTRRSTP